MTNKKKRKKISKFVYIYKNLEKGFTSRVYGISIRSWYVNSVSKVTLIRSILICEYYYKTLPNTKNRIQIKRHAATRVPYYILFFFIFVLIPPPPFKLWIHLEIPEPINSRDLSIFSSPLTFEDNSHRMDYKNFRLNGVVKHGHCYARHCCWLC